MSPALLVAIVVLGVLFVSYARTVIRVDAPVNPSGVVIIRRRHDRWLARGQNVLRYIVGLVIGLALVVYFGVGPNLSHGRTVDVSSQAGPSPVQADVVSTLNDYFADFDTAPVCRYVSAFSESLGPPTILADCESTLDSTPKIRHITVGPYGSVNVQVTFVSRRKAQAGQPHDVCAKWTAAFRMNREAVGLRIAEPPTFVSTPVNC